MNIPEVLNHDEKFRYQLLDRMRCDCMYYLGNGNRQTKYLWAGNEADHIAYMKAIWNSFPEDVKPEWLTFEQIQQFEKQVNKMYGSFKQYAVNADSLIDFLEKYTKRDRHSGRGSEYVEIRIKSHQADIDKYGYTFITHHDSVTGYTVSYYPA